MVIPGILEKDWAKIEQKINICREFSNTIHIDFIDGKFSENITFLDFEKFKEYSPFLILEAHLMVYEPIKHLDKLADAGFKRFLGHIEMMTEQSEFVAKGESLGEVGLALDLQTQIEQIKVPLIDLDSVLLMAVKAGKSGQVFENTVIDKIKKLRSKFLGTIEVDGGINDQTTPFVRDAGARRFVTTSFLFNSEDPKEAFELLKGLG